MQAHIIRQGDGFLLAVQGHDSPLLTYPVSPHQVKALADDVDDALAMEGVTLRAREGQGEGRWIVLDYGTVLVHIFHPEDRKFYHLERLWEDGQNRVPLAFPEEENGEKPQA